MATRTCRVCGATYEHPAPASLSTKRHCHDCAAVDEPTRRVLERHQRELVRLQRLVATLQGTATPTAKATERKPKPASPDEAGNVDVQEPTEPTN